VAFRLDDVQDYFCGLGQRAVMDIFKDFSSPLTIGVIANYFSADDYDNFVYMTSAVNNVTWGVEVAEHGWNHELFTNFSMEQQKTILSDSVTKIQSLFGKRPTSFFPPFNMFNADTLAALNATGFNVFSSQLGSEPEPLNVPPVGLWRFPKTAATSAEPDGGGYFYSAPLAEVWNSIVSTNTTYGFSVVMVHPMEFHNWNGTQYVEDELNTTSLTMLRDLLGQIKAAGMRVVTLNGMMVAFSPPATTGIPTTGIPTTGMMTTGKVIPSSTTRATTVPKASTKVIVGTTVQKIDPLVNGSGITLFSPVAILLFLLYVNNI